jgi:Tol biopolymer transport system component
MPPAAPAQSTPAMAAAPAVGSGDWVQPNDKLVLQGIPPIPASVVQDVARYADFRGHGFVDWHPSRREMLVSHRKAGASTPQIYRLAAPMGELEQLTDFAEPVWQASYEPRTGDSIVFERSSGGDEASQIYRLDLATRQVTVVSEPDMRHDLAGWLNLSSRLIYSSVPLDRTAAGGRRAEIVQTLTLVDPANPDGRRKLAELPGGGWDVGSASWDDRRLVLNRLYSANHSEVWLLDLAGGERTRVLPPPGSNDKAVHLASVWKRDNSGFFFVSDRSGEFRELMF